MEASVDHMAREASSVRKYPSRVPSRAAWSCSMWGSDLSGMVRTTLHPERMCRQSETQLGEDGKVGAPVPRLRHDLFRPAEVLDSIAEGTVELGQGYPHGHALSPVPG